MRHGVQCMPHGSDRTSMDDVHETGNLSICIYYVFYFVLRETTRLPAITPAKGRPQVGADPALSLYHR